MPNTIPSPSFSPPNGFEDDFAVTSSFLEDLLPEKSFQAPESVSKSLKYIFKNDGNHGGTIDFASLFPKECHDDICGL